MWELFPPTRDLADDACEFCKSEHVRDAVNIIGSNAAAVLATVVAGNPVAGAGAKAALDIAAKRAPDITSRIIMRQAVFAIAPLFLGPITARYFWKRYHSAGK